MWHILEADPDALIYIGLAPGVDALRFEQAIADSRAQDMLHAEPAEKGRTFFVPGGRLHAIGAGCLLLEVQQSSNTTYRVYDWGRVGHDGRPRELHIKKALDVIRWDDDAPLTHTPESLPSSSPNAWQRTLRSDYFEMRHAHLTQPETVTMGHLSFHIFFQLAGKLEIKANGHCERISRGTSCLLPAGLDSYELSPLSANSEVARISLPDYSS